MFVYMNFSDSMLYGMLYLQSFTFCVEFWFCGVWKSWNCTESIGTKGKWFIAL